MSGDPRRTARSWSFLLACAIATSSSACVAVEDDTQIAEDLTVCHSTTVEGVDVSEFQGTIDWAAVHRSGRQFAIARVSYGSGYLDPTFSRNWRGIAAAGMIRGVYQYFRPGEDPTAQANIVVHAVGHLGPGDLPAVADVEESGTSLVSKLRTWASVVQAGTGRAPIIYTGPYFWQSNTGSSTAFAHDPLWDADYTSGCPLVFGWTDWKMWQYSDGTCSGCPVRCTVVPGFTNPAPPGTGCPAGSSVDRDRFAGTLTQLRTFAGIVAVTDAGTDASHTDSGGTRDASVDAGGMDAGGDAHADAHTDARADASADGDAATGDVTHAEAGDAASHGDAVGGEGGDGGTGQMPAGCGCVVAGRSSSRGMDALFVAMALVGAQGLLRRTSRRRRAA